MGDKDPKNEIEELQAEVKDLKERLEKCMWERNSVYTSLASYQIEHARIVELRKALMEAREVAQYDGDTQNVISVISKALLQDDDYPRNFPRVKAGDRVTEISKIMRDKAAGRRSQMGDSWCDSWCNDAADLIDEQQRTLERLPKDRCERAVLPGTVVYHVDDKGELKALTAWSMSDSGQWELVKGDKRFQVSECYAMRSEALKSIPRNMA